MKLLEYANYDAVGLATAIVRGDYSPAEVIAAAIDAIEVLNPRLNAVVMKNYANARATTYSGNADRPLGGVPFLIKDVNVFTEDMPTTFSCRFFEGVAPRPDSAIVKRWREAGLVVMGKSNTPEFGAGGNTFNDIFESTHNPHNLSKSAAGSSGGAAASLASGTSWLAQGSDNAGSLRSPASFCGIVGMRPSPGRVARGPSTNPFQHLSVDGPMARNVEDLALLFDAMVGEDKRDPLSLPHCGTSFLEHVRKRTPPRKVAFSPDMGVVPVDPEVSTLCEKAAIKFEEMGIAVERAAPDFQGVQQHYRILRAYRFASALSHHVEARGDVFKPELLSEIRAGQLVTSTELIAADKAIGLYRARAAEFFSEFDLLLTPTTIVPPFPVEQRFVMSCAGTTFTNYLDWLTMAYIFTFVSLPALSLPCGFTQGNLPVGLQMIGPPRGEATLMSAALVLEEMLDINTSPVTPKI